MIAISRPKNYTVIPPVFTNSPTSHINLTNCFALCGPRYKLWHSLFGPSITHSNTIRHSCVCVCVCCCCWPPASVCLEFFFVKRNRFLTLQCDWPHFRNVSNVSVGPMWAVRWPCCSCLADVSNVRDLVDVLARLVCQFSSANMGMRVRKHFFFCMGFSAL